MQPYKNIGGPWRRANGDILAPGEIFYPTGVEVERMEMRQQIGTLFVTVTREEAEAHGVTLSLPVEPRATGSDTVDPGSLTEPSTVHDEDEDEESEDVDEEGSPTAPTTPWPLRMRPTLYLQLHPQGPQAALAKEYAQYEQAVAAHNKDKE